MAWSKSDGVKISEKTGGAYADMSDVIDNELDDIFGSEWTSHGSHSDKSDAYQSGQDGCITNTSENSTNGDKK